MDSSSDSSQKPKRLKSPSHDNSLKTSISCTNMPEGLFDAETAKQHFSKFGKVTKILLRPKKQACVISYDTHVAAEKAFFNAGAFDGFMFDVTWTKTKRRRSKKEEDPDWVPDSDIEEELNAMGATPLYQQQRPTKEAEVTLKPTYKPAAVVPRRQPVKASAMRKPPIREKPILVKSSVVSGTESPIIPVSTSMTTSEAATELRLLRNRISRTADEQRRTLDARDRILRAWGGNGSRVKVGGATIGTCPDMCPEKERLQRQAEYQVMNFEAEDGDSTMSDRLAVKQYSRSSADQETPMCYELRPPRVLAMTMSYLLNEIADSQNQVSLADWFHFMWDRCRGIRKDITQQALCCAESVRLVEQCARFHAHCAARLADLEHTQFDQRLNTDNLTKCLQSLKHMYADLGPEHKPCEHEFRGYIALLNLGDSNFWWEIQQLPANIQKSQPVIFAIEIFTALDNNNYVRFFRLIKERATYLQACILLRYVNDVRARALARYVKAFAPRGGSKYPANELLDALAFESIESMKSFINHYGLRFSRTENEELCVILDRNQFIEDSDPYPTARAIHLIESKRSSSVGEIIAGGKLPSKEYEYHVPHSSFNENGTLKEPSLVAEDQEYDTKNDSNKDLEALKLQLKVTQPEVSPVLPPVKSNEVKFNPFQKLPTNFSANVPLKPLESAKFNMRTPSKVFSFQQPAIPSNVKTSPEKVSAVDTKGIFSFSKPQETGANLWQTENKGSSVFSQSKLPQTSNLFAQKDKPTNIFSKPIATEQPQKSFFGPTSVPKDNTNLFATTVVGNTQGTESLFQVKNDESSNNQFKQSVFGKVDSTQGVKPNIFANKNSLFARPNENKTNIFSNPTPVTNETKSDSIFSKPKGTTANVFSKPSTNLFAPPPYTQTPPLGSGTNLFSSVTKEADAKPIFGGKVNTEFFGKTNEAQAIFGGGASKSPSSLFKSALANTESEVHKDETGEGNTDSSKNPDFLKQRNNFSLPTDLVKPNFGGFSQGAPHINFQTPSEQQKQDEDQMAKQEEEKRRQEEHIKLEEQRRLEKLRKQEELKKEEERKRLEQQRKKEEEQRRIQEEKLRQEELKKRLEEEKKQAELKKIAEEKRKAEEARKKAEEERRLLLERIDKESFELVEELADEINVEVVEQILTDEMEQMRILVQTSEETTKEILTDLCYDICRSELIAEKFWTEKLLRKWSKIWMMNCIRNKRRRDMVQGTPVWLPYRSTQQEAEVLRRRVEQQALTTMSKFHNGYKFTGELQEPPLLQPYNVVDVVRSSLLRRMKDLSQRYQDCFYWKFTISSPGENKRMNRRIEIHNWARSAFGDGHKHKSKTLIHLKRQSWNSLMNFAVSICLNDPLENNINESLQGSNGILFYTTEDDGSLHFRINSHISVLKERQIMPIAVIMPKSDCFAVDALNNFLQELVKENAISNYKIFNVVPEQTHESVYSITKSAIKFLAKNYPNKPPLEIDYAKSVLHRCLGSEFWSRLKRENSNQVMEVRKDLNNLVQLYNTAVDKITNILTDKNIGSYSCFAEEFDKYLNKNTAYPKGYEFIPSLYDHGNNIEMVKSILKEIKLPEPNGLFYPTDLANMQAEIRSYCKQITWPTNSEEIACKAIAIMPDELCDLNISPVEFSQMFEHYDFVDLMNVLVTEKINSLKDVVFIVYDKMALAQYRNSNWWHDVEPVVSIKHKAIEYKEDDIDYVVDAKRRKLSDVSHEYLQIEDKDSTLVEENIKMIDDVIAQYDCCSKSVHDLETLLEEETRKASDLEKLLRTALNEV